MLILLGVGLLVISFAAAAFLGAPYLPTRRTDISTALELLNLRPGQTMLDLGSGDGALLVSAAKQGINGIGYEINPILWIVSKIRTYKYRKLIKIYLKSYWRARLPKVDGIYVFLISHYMKKLDKKLTKEIKQPTKVVSFTFLIPGRQSEQKVNGLYLYRYP